MVDTEEKIENNVEIDSTTNIEPEKVEEPVKTAVDETPTQQATENITASEPDVNKDQEPVESVDESVDTTTDNNEQPVESEKKAEKKTAVINIERFYIIPLRDVKRMPCYKRANAAIKDIRHYLEHHMKSTDVKLDKSINKAVWARGSQKPPRRIRVRAIKFDDGQVQA